ncbi:hypothetical protein H8D85_02680 [bacterium]|nr:hypothetical protein [bacterium]
MDAVASGALSGAAQGASMGMALGPWGAAVGAVGGGIYGAVQGKKGKEAEIAATAEAARIEQEESAARDALAASAHKKKQLEQWNAAESQDTSYDNTQYSGMAGTSTLPTAGAQNLPVTAQPQTQTSSDAQLQALGVIS